RTAVHAAVIAALATAAACAPRTVDPLTPPPVVTHRDPQIRQLQHDLAAIFAAAELERGSAGVVVQSVDRGDTLFRYNAHRLLIPASALKLITVAVAAEVLGWDYRFTTTLSATGPIEGGVLRGDLVVTGEGDPSISRRYFEDAPVLEAWARRLAADGLRRIEGRLVADDRAFAPVPWGHGWEWEDVRYAYGAPVSALHVNEATAPLLIVPGLEAGDPASVSLLQSYGLTVEADVTTAQTGTPPDIEFHRVPGEKRLRVTGRIAEDAEPLLLRAAVPDATRQFLEALQDALQANGIIVTGGLSTISESDDPPVALAPPLLEHRSPPLSALAAVTLKDSHNLHAEALLRAIARTGQPVASDEAGVTIVSRVLKEWGVPEGSVAAADGSGLSRRNYATPDALLTVLRRMATDERHRDHWLAALPLAGSEGTLARRFESGPARGRVRAKTGSLAYVRALAGYVRSADEELLAFAIMLNDASAPRSSLDNAIDRAVNRLAEFRR
ncbi:MAG TPA: D-alanyl-D-alanine carboxypeptidase/D-alanyl-D-alanine-endopeptidase, partial [Vicinamibacterales bacterium]|nr:D-alanyl-D-alanine carboxypeptidase/D-alanyl-D-alanine-endopeptidase [Vicinamibacterales bacterium]